MSQPKGTGQQLLDIPRLRQLGVWLPVTGMAVLMGLLGLLSFSLEVERPILIGAYLGVMALIAFGAYVFSNSIFDLVEQKEAEVLWRNKELATLNAVGAVISESSDLESVLTRSLDKVLEMTGAESGEILLAEARADALVLRAFRGAHADAFQSVAQFKPDAGQLERITRERKPILIDDLSSYPGFGRPDVAALGLRAYAGIPLLSKGRVAGVLGIYSTEAGRLTEQDLGLLEGLGSQLGVAIEHSKLSDQLKTMTVVEERHRIAREMHDGLAQELAFLYLKLGELEARNGAAEVGPELRQMKTVASRAYEEVRHGIFGLKTMTSRGIGFIPTLAEYLHEFTHQTEIPAKLQIVDEEATRFSPQVEIQLIRIIQEALSNVRRHAHARQAWVSFDVDGSDAKICIEDDGQGFDAAEAMKPGRGSFGLQAIRERAESLGGRLQVDAKVGGGTRVVAWLPAGGGQEWSA